MYLYIKAKWCVLNWHNYHALVFNETILLWLCYNLANFIGCLPAQGFYGFNCSIPCPDLNCQYCHTETGSCQICKPGYKGPRCETGIWKSFFFFGFCKFIYLRPKSNTVFMVIFVPSDYEHMINKHVPLKVYKQLKTFTSNGYTD